MKHHYKNLLIDYIPTIKRSDCHTLMRIVVRGDFSHTIEYTLFLDFPEVVIFLNLWCPTEKSDIYKKKLEWTAEKLIKMNVLYNDKLQPIKTSKSC